MPGEGRPFSPGNQAAKGHGRPEGSHVSICQKYASERGWQKLIDLSEGVGKLIKDAKGREIPMYPDFRIQLEALKVLILYAYGRPTENETVPQCNHTLFSWLQEGLKNSKTPSGLGNNQQNPNSDQPMNNQPS